MEGLKQLERLEEFIWRMPPTGDMRVEGLICADERLLPGIAGALEQLRAVASLPGIAAPAYCMPDAHQGYGFPIGGVAAFDAEEGIISPGGVGYDINCGVRLLRSKLKAEELTAKDRARLADALFALIPAGVGVGGGIKLSPKEMRQVLTRGAAWAVGRGLGEESDLEYCESSGQLAGADPDQVGERALKRGSNQVGTLGAGNHFVEIAQVSRVFDPQAAQSMGLELGQVVLWIHSGSRGLGHQVCDDFLRRLHSDASALHPADRQLVSAHAASPLGRAYLGAMFAAANYAFANRQVLGHLARQAFLTSLNLSPRAVGLGLVYDVAHNLAKLETHRLNNIDRRVWVHRKGATRALGPGHPELPSRYGPVGQPVLVPGDMGRASYVLRGTPASQARSLASSAHGAGRAMSRTKAKSQARGRLIDQELARQGILVRARSRATLAEEMPESYKDASQVVGAMHGSGWATLVVETRPLVVIKG